MSLPPEISPPFPEPRASSLTRRAIAFFFDSMLLSVLLPLIAWLLQQPQQPHELLSWTIFGLYRVIAETGWGTTAGKALVDLKVLYRDPTGGERTGIRRLGAALLRNSWLLIGAAVWLWNPENDLGWLLFLIALSMLFSRSRKSLMDHVAGAWVIHTAPLKPPRSPSR